MSDAGSTRPGVGPYIGQLRRRKNLSQRELSRIVGRSPAYFSKLEAGSVDPSLSAFSDIAVALDLNPMETWILVRMAAITVTHKEDTHTDPLQGGE